LDRGGGECSLAKPEMARIVADAFAQFEGIRYRLYAWCVMPNHVHVVFEPLGSHRLSGILHSWKSFTATAANRLLGRVGAFWQREYYDRLLRNGNEFNRAVRYVLENPERAGLKNWRWVWFRS
jgi:REP element-mobilizing transposase RayT